MESNSLSFMLENGLNLREVLTTGSILHINQEFDENDLKFERNKDDQVPVDILGQPVPNFAGLSEKLVPVKETGYVKKKIIEEGGGLPIHEGCTVFIAFSGYWENELMPFDVVPLNKPLEVDLKDNGLLPGLQIAVKSMLVGETAVFLLSYQVMYGEMGVPPRIKPKADCVFYIKLVRSIITPKEGKINFSEPNMFQRVHHEIKLMYSSGCTLYQTKNYMAAIQLFKKSVNMLHKCRLADENEEQIQQKFLKKLYMNLAICYNHVKKPLLTCCACNELHRLRSLWNNGKALYQNAKALRMIASYPEAEKKLKKAMSFYPKNEEMMAEYDLLMKTWNSSKTAKQNSEIVTKAAIGLVSEEFKKEVDELVSSFKLNNEEHQLVIPSNFNADEIAYFKEVCIRENLFFKKFNKNYLPYEGKNQDNPELYEDVVLNKRSECIETKNKRSERKEIVEIESDIA